MAHIATAVLVLLVISAHSHVIGIFSNTRHVVLIIILFFLLFDHRTRASRERNLTEATNNHRLTAGLLVAEWGGWSSWFCSVPCRATGFFVRTRNCNQPRETSIGCDGAVVQQSGACNTSQILCPFECMDDFWGVGCDKRCPFTCLGHRCDHTSGLCSSCLEYYFGDRCQFRCPTGRYGEKCQHTCRLLCFRGCNLQTGSCAADIAIYVVVVTAMTMASFLPAILAYHEYLRTHDSTS